jgi:predicted O-methyltransferase YrrM
MSDEKWTAVDDHLAALFAAHDDSLDGALDGGRAAGLPQIQVSPLHGKLLYLLARAIGARRILEIGTLAGYSAIWLARALPDGGRLVTLELDAQHAAVARRSMEQAGLGDRVDIIVGPAAESLRRLVQERSAPFDLVFIDADKEGYPEYLELSLSLTGPGSLIVADNVVRGGAIIDPDGDARVRGTRIFLEQLAADERVEATVIQTVGEKGYDGLAIAHVR